MQGGGRGQKDIRLYLLEENTKSRPAEGEKGRNIRQKYRENTREGRDHVFRTIYSLSKPC